MVLVAQLVRASLCGSEGREFEPRQAPIIHTVPKRSPFHLKKLGNSIPGF